MADIVRVSKHQILLRAAGTMNLQKSSWCWAAAAVAVAAVTGWLIFGQSGAGEPAPKTSKGATTKGAQSATPATFVTVAPVAETALLRRVTAVGDLHGYEEIAVSAKVDGRIRRVLHEVGDIVRPGDVLVELDDVDGRLAVDEARRALELECAKLGLAQPPEGEFDVSMLPSVVKAGASERFAAAQVARADKLAERAAVSREERERLASELEIAHAGYRQAQLDARTTLAQIRHRQATLEILLERLRETRVTVPSPSQPPPEVAEILAQHKKAIDCSKVEFVVTQRMAREGEFLRPSMGQGNVFQLAIDRPLKLKSALPERHRPDVQVGQRVEVTVEAHPGQVFAGRVARVSPAIDRTNRTFEVEIIVANPQRQLAPGSFAKASIITREARALTVPESAVLSFEGVNKVYVVDQGVARSVPVQLGQRKPGGAGEAEVEVTGDLRAGQTLATSGHARLSDGSAVQIRETRTAHRVPGDPR
jgi:multidrug efflux pump subunit AcrA (membrane-fusion protein)